VIRSSARHVAVVGALASALTFAAVGSAAALNGAPKLGGAQCKGADAKSVVHAAAVKREGTLAALVARLQARRDPFAMNGPQITTLQQASSAIVALDAKIQATCYSTRTAFRADAVTLWTSYRVYWLRVPQSHAIEAADRFAEARSRLDTAAQRLAGLVGTNSHAKSDLDAMNTVLAGVDAKLGVAPTPGASIAAVRDLQPAVDMTADTAALETAHADLLSIYQQLQTARAEGLKVVSELQG